MTSRGGGIHRGDREDETTSDWHWSPGPESDPDPGEPRGFWARTRDENLLGARCLGRFGGHQRRGLPLSRRLRGVATTKHELQRVDAVLPRPRVYEGQRAERGGEL